MATKSQPLKDLSTLTLRSCQRVDKHAYYLQEKNHIRSMSFVLILNVVLKGYLYLYSEKDMF